MNIVTVIPITKGFFKESLSYFTTRDVEPGTVITIPLRSKQVAGLVISKTPATAQKSELKSASFGLKPLGTILSTQLFTPGFMEAVKETALFHGAPLGQVIKSFTPKVLLEGKLESLSFSAAPKGARFEQVAIQAEDEERFTFYKSLVREEFARKKSVLFLVPTIADCEKVVPHLQKGIEEHTIILSGTISPKKLRAAWKRIAEEKHSLLVVATPGFLSLPRTDFGVIVLERESATQYKSGFRPFVDARRAATSLAKALNTRIVFGDLLLRVETLEKNDAGLFVTLLPLKFRAVTKADTRLINMREEALLHKQHDMPALSNTLKTALTEIHQQKGHTILFAHRKGIASMTICRDCGSYLACTRCKAPLVLRAHEDQHFFLCHKCWREYSAETACNSCGSWRLLPMGAGVEKIVEEVLALLPNAPLFQMHSDAVTNHKKARESAHAFFESPGGIMVGTEMMLPYITQQAELVAAVSLDSLFALPDFRIHEKLFHIGITLRQAARNYFLIQTRAPDRAIFDYILQGNLIDFYRDELTVRRKFKYPPFTLLIKITCEGPEKVVVADMQQLALLLADWKPLMFPAFSAPPEGNERLHALIRLEPKEWPNENLLSVLTSLPPRYSVTIDPEDIL